MAACASVRSAAMKQGIKRLYDKVAVSRRAADEFLIQLDGRTLKTPAKDALVLPTEELAFGIAVEWEKQEKMIRPDTMPLMKLATTALDQVPHIRPTMTDSMLRCLDSDSACFRSVDEPKLMIKEEEHYAPLLSWARTELEIDLATSTSLTLQHPPFSVSRAQMLLAEADDWEVQLPASHTNEEGCRQSDAAPHCPDLGARLLHQRKQVVRHLPCALSQPHWRRAGGGRGPGCRAAPDRRVGRGGGGPRPGCGRPHGADVGDLHLHAHATQVACRRGFAPESRTSARGRRATCARPHTPVAAYTSGARGDAPNM